MKIHSIETGFFKLDGGAMFGVVPKSIWNRINPADDNNMCTWAMRCLLIEDDNRLILIDTGIGNKQDEKFFSHYYLHGDSSLASSLRSKGFSFADVTDVILTHLHFDHCGGAIIRQGDKLLPAFPNATYWSNARHWKWATEPNAREKASFLKENILPLKESGQLKFIEDAAAEFPLNISIRQVFGHTDAMMLPQFTYKGRSILYMADLLPSAGHIPLPYVMAYDMFPLTTLNEKKSFLEEAVENETILFFEHDPKIECATLQRTEKGVRLKEEIKLSDLG
jgi:glyoxylase-like metal-dependent hydrolase (beta-lactamase superfamily II)